MPLLGFVRQQPPQSGANHVHEHRSAPDSALAPQWALKQFYSGSFEGSSNKGTFDCIAKEKKLHS